MIGLLLTILLLALVVAACRSNTYTRSTTDHEHAETLRLAREEQKALEMAISKSQKKLKEVAASTAAGT